MRVKSKYRQQFRDGGRVDQAELPVEPIAQPVESAAPEAPPAEATVEQPPAPPQAPPQPEQPPQQDDATLALKQQIESLRQSEQARRQQAAQVALPQEPMSREERLAQWQAQGLSDPEVQFFQKHPEMLDFPQITSFAIHRAMEAGLERGTDAHFAAVEKIFNANLHHMQTQAAQPAMQTPTPNFFRPPPGPAARTAPNPASFTSAPVSRSIPTGSSRPRGKVVLTPSEVEAARVAGITVEEYARQKVLYENMKADGSYRDARETQR